MVINSSKDQSDPVIQGMKMILSNFQKELDKMGVTVYHDHEIFNPHFHEAIKSVDGDEDNKIVNVYKKAYLINENLLRPAQVVVSKKKEE